MKRRLSDYLMLDLSYNVLHDKKCSSLVNSKNSSVATSYAVCVAIEKGVDKFIKMKMPAKTRNDAIHYLLQIGKYSLTKEDKIKLIDNIEFYYSAGYDWDEVASRGIAPYLTKKYSVERIPYTYLLSNRKKDVQKAVEYYSKHKLLSRDKLFVTKVLESALLKADNIKLIIKVIQNFLSNSRWNRDKEQLRVFNLIKSKNISIFDIVCKGLGYNAIYCWMLRLSEKRATTKSFVLKYFKPVFQKYRKEFNIKVIDEDAETSIEIGDDMLEGYKEFVKKEKKEVV